MTNVFFDPASVSSENSTFGRLEDKLALALEYLKLDLNPIDLVSSLSFIRVQTLAKPRKKNGSYLYIPSQFFYGCNWETGEEVTLFSFDRPLSLDTRVKIMHEMKKENQRAKDICKAEVAEIMSSATNSINHKYVDAKGIKPYGALQVESKLVIPIMNIHGELVGCQYISSSGSKWFQKGTEMKGGHAVLGRLGGDGPILICEGWATACSIHEATDATVVIAFNCGNLVNVAKSFKNKFPNTLLVICADNDEREGREDNPGIESALKARDFTGATVVWPERKSSSERITDFNDVHALRGLEALYMLLKPYIVQEV